jgi:hypothetical protein
MIIGTIALLTILFGGGLIDTFFVAKLDKGVKEYVLDKERQKEIRADIKSTKKYIKQFNKGRKSQFKDLKEMLGSRTATRTDFEDFYAELHRGRIEYQDQLIDDRLALTQQIQADEWTSIIEFSASVIDQREEKSDKKNQEAQKMAEEDPDKARKKAAKAEQKQPFFKTREAVTEAVDDVEKQTLMFTSLDDMMMASQESDRQIRSVNVRNNDMIVRRDATRDEFQQIADLMNRLRRSAFEQVVQTHMIIKENTNESQWRTILKAFNKDLDLAIR